MSFPDGLRGEIVAWSKTAGRGWLFVCQTTLAALLAMGISMRFELGQPVTAMVTVYVLMQPQTGMVLTKSWYRVFGTLAGAAASLALLALFAQERALFLPGLALWVGLCTAGAALYRNFKSYSFTLAGYTAAMIALPLAMQPTGFFDYAVNRVTEVAVGIMCAGIVSGVIFPQSLGNTILRTLQGRYTEFIGFVHAMLTGGMNRRDADRAHLRFIGNILNLESLRGAVMTEATAIRGRDLWLRRLNRDFMAASTTFHSLYQLLNRLKRAAAPAARELDALCVSLADVLAAKDKSAPSAGEDPKTARRLAEFRAAFPRRAEVVRQKYIGISDDTANLDCETGLELLKRLVRELHDYAAVHSSLIADRRGLIPPDATNFACRTDPMVAILTGVRAMVAILLVAVFWMASAWPNGSSAVMMAAIGCALFAPAPDPARAVKMGLFGVLIAFITTFPYKFIIMTSLDGFGPLCASMVPFMLLGPYLSLKPRLSTMGLGYSCMFCFMIAPTNTMQYDPVQYLNFGSALMLGLAAATVIFGVFVPATGAWFKRRTARLLQRQITTACCGPLQDLDHRFESGTRDILQRLATRQSLQDGRDRKILEWMFIVLEIGRAVIHLRQDARTASLPQRLLNSVNKTLRSIDTLFSRPTMRNHDAALESVAETMALLREESERDGLSDHTRDIFRRMLTPLHLIRTSLLDDETILTATTAVPRSTFEGETVHAS